MNFWHFVYNIYVACLLLFFPPVIALLVNVVFILTYYNVVVLCVLLLLLLCFICPFSVLSFSFFTHIIHVKDTYIVRKVNSGMIFSRLNVWCCSINSHCFRRLTTISTISKNSYFLCFFVNCFILFITFISF